MKRTTSALLNGLLTLWLYAFTSVAQAGDFEIGMQALEQGYTQQAIELWRPLAQIGDPDAQFGLGVIYNDAMGVPQDYAEANYWFLRAAEQGFAPAQYNLGNAYKNATGMHQDDAMAVIWWRKAAEQDFGPAQFNLGSALLHGSGVARNEAAGLEWYRRAAENGHPIARSYLEEQGVAADIAGSVAGTAATATAEDSRPTPVHTPPPPVALLRPRPAAPPVATPRVSSPATDSMTEIDPQACRDWLQQAGDAAYTIQLMASREAQSAHHFLRDSALQPAPVVCPYATGKGVWYAIVTGQYPNATQARQALAELPEAVRKAGPYLRKIPDLRRRVGTAP